MAENPARSRGAQCLPRIWRFLPQQALFRMDVTVDEGEYIDSPRTVQLVSAKLTASGRLSPNSRAARHLDGEP